MIEAYSGSSTSDDAFRAGLEAAQAAIALLPHPPDIIWAFGAIKFDQEQLLAGIGSVAPGVTVIGCSTDGEIATTGLGLDSLVTLAVASDTIRFHTAQVEQVSADSYAAGAALGEKFKNLDCSYIQIFTEGIKANADEILLGMKASLGNDISVAGGASGDGGVFKQTFQYHNESVLTDSIVAVAFEGDFEFSTGVGCGWFPVGIAKKVTKATGNVVYELDGQPALQVYEKYLGRHASKLPAVGVEYPLGLLAPTSEPDDSDTFVCRATMGVDHQAGSITFAGDIPEGVWVKMTMGYESDIIQAATEAARTAMDKLLGRNPEIKPKIVFIYSCMARKIVLGSKTQNEIAAVQNIVGDTIPIIGFYTYGEFAPAGESNASYFHNETVTLSIIGE